MLPAELWCSGRDGVAAWCSGVARAWGGWSSGEARVRAELG